MVDISAETWNKAGVAAISVHKNNDVNKTLLQSLCISNRWGDGVVKIFMTWLIKKLKENTGLKTWQNLTKPQIRKHEIDRAKLFKCSKHSMYVHEDIAVTTIMQSRLSDPKTIKFKADLGFNQINLIPKKEQSVVIPLLKAFSAEKIKLQHKTFENERARTNMYLFEHKFTVEIDEKGHTDRNQDKKKRKRNKSRKTFWQHVFSQD